MGPLVFLAALTLHDPPPTIDQNSFPDTSRKHGTTEVRQESERTRPVQEPSEGGLLLNQETILDRMLSDQGSAERHVAAIDSLLKAHPDLKGLVLRELLMAKPPEEFYATSLATANDAWRLAGNSRMTAFERSGMIKKRQMEIHDTWTEGRILAPHMDMIGTVHWLLELLR